MMKAFSLLVVVLLAGCQFAINPPSTGKDVASSTNETTAENRSLEGSSDSTKENPKLILSFPGFYQSKTPIFQPKSIGYQGLLKRSDVHSGVQLSMENDYQVAPHNHLESFFAPDDPGFASEIKTFIEEKLAHTRHYLFTDQKKCSDCPIDLPDELKIAGKADRIVLVTGLEVRMPTGGLRSGLTAVAYTGAGEFLGLESTTYDFRTYNAEAMIEDSIELLEKLAL